MREILFYCNGVDGDSAHYQIMDYIQYVHCDAVLFILWAFVPDVVLHRHGITYYPSRYWAMAIPTWLCVTVLFLYLAYAW